jgi:muramoyltetrapeptide carboxypeptidase LdcA involved in peptidoglycan recycling
MEKSIPKKFLRPLRGLISDRKALQFIFSDWSEKMGGVPVWHGLPVGHGGGLEALPIGAMATVAKDRLWIQPERRTER